MTINGDTEAAVSAVAKRFVNTTDNVANWANLNHQGLITDIIAQTQDVTIVKTKATFEKDVNGNLILV